MQEVNGSPPMCFKIIIMVDGVIDASFFSLEIGQDGVKSLIVAVPGWEDCAASDGMNDVLPANDIAETRRIRKILSNQIASSNENGRDGTKMWRHLICKYMAQM